MRLAIVTFTLLLAVLIGACRKTEPPPGPDPPPDTISGRERIGWDQMADDTAELATFGYAIYVDDARTELADVTCGSTAAAPGFPCSARLPAMTPGTHALQLAAFTSDGGVVESARSPVLRVVVGAVAVGTGAVEWRTGVEAADGVRLDVERLVDGLVDPADAAFTPDGRLFIAERGGRVRVVADGRLHGVDALQLDDVSPGPNGGLLSLAIDPAFARTRFVYVVYTVHDARGTTFRLARFREAGGILAERAILADGIPASPSRASASLRFGPDAKLYLALDDGDDAERAARPASATGKLLRMNDDGGTPRDQAGATPVVASGLRNPRGLGWHTSGLLWIADEGRTGAGALTALAAGGAAPLRLEVRARRALDDFHPSSMAFHDGGGSAAFAGNLFVASNEDRAILRIRFDPADSRRVVAAETLLKDRVGGVRVVTTGPDGAIYFCTADALGRLVSR